MFIIIIFMLISCLSIYSSQKYLPYDEPFALKQLVWYGLGFTMSAFIYFLDLEQIRKISLIPYLFGVLILFVLIISPESIAPEIKGIRAWFVIPGINFSLQPAEFMKIFLIIYLANLIVWHNDKHPNRTISSDLVLIGKAGFVTFLPILLILQQPDAGTAMVICAIMLGMLFLSGVHWKLISCLAVLGILLLCSLIVIYLKFPELLLLVLDQYQLDRIHSWLDPFGYRNGIGYQLTQSILAIGSGVTGGKGFNNGDVIVPESHSDFIFTVIGEEYGFIGSSLVIILYFFLIYRIIIIALRHKGDYEILIAAGVTSMLTFHIVENIGMVIGLVPITGIPLPLLSYGGSSILATLLALNLILNISAKTKRYMFSEND
ncbi:FtsW/RodA/SpoVE family cell cycle protein [Peribacillus sp. SCS-155]|uniref:FtsW/RodA/SpoVE family cell cycle protein n=1 Tax=Peribacillus sedimenti TaxID=3115297 RepID=UPI003906994F